MSDFDNIYVKLTQVAQMLKALGTKGWGRRELTLLGCATPEKLEEVRAVLQGRVRLEPVARRWWWEGDRISVLTSNEGRSGPEVLVQNPEQFGRHLFLGVRERLPKISRGSGRGELMAVKLDRYRGESYYDIVKSFMDEFPELAIADDSAMLQLTKEDVVAMSPVERLVIVSDLINNEVSLWVSDGRPGNTYLMTVPPRNKAGVIDWVGIDDHNTWFLFERKAN